MRRRRLVGEKGPVAGIRTRAADVRAEAGVKARAADVREEVDAT